MSVYLSRLLLNPSNRRVQSELAHPYEMHRTLMKAFPEIDSDSAREAHGVLFRVDVDELTDEIAAFVQSTAQPDWSHVAGELGYLRRPNGTRNPDHKEIENFLAAIQTEQKLAFRLRANPTKRIHKDDSAGGKLKGKRVGLLREEEKIAWLRRKGESGGFELCEVRIGSDREAVKAVPRVIVRFERIVRNRKTDAGGMRHKTTHLSAEFEGILRVMDADAFRQTLIKGIGSAKAYGFGLMSVAPHGS